MFSHARDGSDRRTGVTGLPVHLRGYPAAAGTAIGGVWHYPRSCQWSSSTHRGSGCQGHREAGRPTALDAAVLAHFADPTACVPGRRTQALNASWSPAGTRLTWSRRRTGQSSPSGPALRPTAWLERVGRPGEGQRQTLRPELEDLLRTVPGLESSPVPRLDRRQIAALVGVAPFNRDRLGTLRGKRNGLYHQPPQPRDPHGSLVSQKLALIACYAPDPQLHAQAAARTLARRPKPSFVLLQDSCFPPM